MIVVTGATGTLGRLIVSNLLKRVPADRLGVSVRDPSKAAELKRHSVRVHHGDFAVPGSLKAAFEGATQIVLVSSNARAHGGDTLAQHHAAIAAARAAGVHRIVYTSHMGVGASSAFAPMRDHAATEAMLRESGIAWTALRNGFYASTVRLLMGDAMSSGILAAPEDGKVSWTGHGDLAEAAAAILLQEEAIDGPTPPLTASKALDLNDVADVLTDLGGRSIRRDVITDAEQADRMAAHGAPSGAIDMTLGLYRAARAGEFAAVDSTLETVLGHAPTSLRDMLAAGGDN